MPRPPLTPEQWAQARRLRDGGATFAVIATPASGHAITAGFEFDVPVRFDTDKLEIDIQGFRHGAIPSIPIVEIRV